ncbi:monooxygenase FAD-binding protein [Actinobacteria bacterium OK074]|nr:monooxygenase FAD-binding protein [Actinobacteria bacterium OK074]
MTKSPAPRAVVVGGGVAGLLAAAVLAEYADVTLVERDTLPEGPEPRRGLPQARHAHVVGDGGVTALDALLPGIVDELAAAGARLTGVPEDCVVRGPGAVWLPRQAPHLSTARSTARSPARRGLLCSRDLLDATLRDRVLALPRVVLRQHTVAVGLAGDTGRVGGVRVRPARGGRTEAVEDEAAGELLPADLVLDASGRSSRAPDWLADLGLAPVREREVDAGVCYATRVFRAPGATAEHGFPLVHVQADPARPPGRGGIILPVEDGRWLVSLYGTEGGEPSGDEDAFVPFARALDDPLLGRLLTDAEPLTGVFTTHSTANRRRYYEQPSRRPEGFAVLGDAVAGFNPVYGHGVTVAAQSALALREVLRGHGPAAPGTARRIQRAVAGPVAAAWDLAAGQDAGYPGAGQPTTVLGRLLTGQVRRAVATGARDPRALAVLLDVLALSAPATRLFSRELLLPLVLGRARQQPSAEPPLTEAERKTVGGLTAS